VSEKPLRAFDAPITSVSGRASSLDQPKRKQAKVPQWTYWARMKSTSPWKLAALSLCIEPSTVDPHDATTFPDEATFGRFTLITEAIKKRFCIGEDQQVPLGAFIRWAIDVSLDIPIELSALTAASRTV
jgi:hypothetical protein